ncbi:MAG: hypothetical protein WCU88_10395 [Elusimicrobiota bacterium]
MPCFTQAQTFTPSIVPAPAISAPIPLLPAPSMMLPAPQLKLDTPLLLPQTQPQPSQEATAVPEPGIGSPAALMEKDLSMESILKMQGFLLGILSERSGQTPTLISMLMAIQKNGLNMTDYAEILRSLIEIEASPEEIRQAVLDATKDTPFARPLGPENRPDEGDYALLRAMLLETVSEVEILRSHRFFSWIQRWESGDFSVKLLPQVEVRRLDDGRVFIRLGALISEGTVAPLSIVMHPMQGHKPDLSTFLDRLLRSPGLSEEDRSSLLRLARSLEQEGLLPPG